MVVLYYNTHREVTMFTVREINKELTYDIRSLILRPNQPREAAMYETDDFAGSFHVGVFDDEKLICIVSFCLEDYDSFKPSHQYRLRAMATLEEYRNKGAGSMAVQFAEKILREREVDVLWCKARVTAMGYYKKLGFTTYGDVFDYHPIGEHIIMYKMLK